MNTTLNISSGPHIRDRWSTRFIMCMVLIALCPTAIVGVVVNWLQHGSAAGVHVLTIILVSVFTAVFTEFLWGWLMKKPGTWKDGSAAVTGLMLALTLSPNTPIYLPIIGSLFAILVAKCLFGGLGKNFVNPALAARCFLLISFATPMTQYAADAVSGATPVAELAAGKAVNITSMFLGTAPGVIGGSVIAIAAGGLFLWAMDIIHGQIWISVLVAFTLFLGIFGGQGFDPAFLAAHLCGGGVMLGAFFMATDYVTSPVSRLGQTVFGAFIGIMGAMFRIFGTAADSFSYSIIIANLFVPLIDRYIISKPYAYRKNAIRIQQGIAKVPFFKKIPRAVVVITAIALFAGLALSGIYMLTKDAIAEQKAAAELKAYQAVVPEAESFEKVEAVNAYKGQVYGTSYGRVFINEAVRGRAADGLIVGYAISATSAEGYDGNITISVGLDNDGVITSVSFTELHETPGKGMLADAPKFKDQFSGKQVKSFKLLKDGGSQADNEIDGISGATVSSKAIVNAVNAALDFYQNVLGGGTNE